MKEKERKIGLEKVSQIKIETVGTRLSSEEDTDLELELLDPLDIGAPDIGAETDPLALKVITDHPGEETVGTVLPLTERRGEGRETEETEHAPIHLHGLALSDPQSNGTSPHGPTGPGGLSRIRGLETGGASAEREYMRGGQTARIARGRYPGPGHPLQPGSTRSAPPAGGHTLEPAILRMEP